MFVPLISHFFLHIIDMTHWLLPFTNRTEMEEARKGGTPAVLKETLAAFKNEMLKEHLWPPARSQFKEVWIAYISKHFTQSSASPTLPRLRLLRDHPVGLVEEVLLENIKWLYTQTSVLCCADASQ